MYVVRMQYELIKYSAVTIIINNDNRYDNINDNNNSNSNNIIHDNKGDNNVQIW